MHTYRYAHAVYIDQYECMYMGVYICTYVLFFNTNGGIDTYFLSLDSRSWRIFNISILLYINIVIEKSDSAST